MDHYLHIAEIDHRLRERVGELVEFVSGEKGVRRGGEIRIGNKGGLKADISGLAKGRITPFDGAGKGMSPFQYIQSEMNLSFPGAIEWAANWLGISPDYKPDPEAELQRTERKKVERQEAEAVEKADQEKRTAKAVAILGATQDATGTPVKSYLKARAIIETLPPDIRYLPPQNGTYGAMVAVARDNAGTVQAIQRVFINENRKAPVKIQKRTNGVMDGAAVRLPAMQGDELVLTEGPETGLSVWQLWGRETWVALGSIAKLVDTVPIGRPVIVARDADKNGSPADKALMKAVAAMTERGISVRVVSPPNPTKNGYDFNDALMDYGSEAVIRVFESSGQVRPRYPAQTLTVQEGRCLINNAFSDWTSNLPAYWQEKVVYDALMSA
jgi:hypothetical protein